MSHQYTKNKDPKRAAADGKLPLHLLPPAGMAEPAKVLQFGEAKYGPWNWRETGVCVMTYVAAIRRHLDKLVDGDMADDETGLSHFAHIAANAMIVLDAQRHGILEDDRPPRPFDPLP